MGALLCFSFQSAQAQEQPQPLWPKIIPLEGLSLTIYQPEIEGSLEMCSMLDPHLVYMMVENYQFLAPSGLEPGCILIEPKEPYFTIAFKWLM